ncbi:hypothetical protein F2Q70_00011721 [Brassica cretica]|uniref:Uncharacterized protein n=1 Tax=Brassica cretica TaxID=69181 RepID=A0A8S9LW23_BRACR|nr:hypothetical protein F2Q70_00011721 [Brassica cretica]
MALLVHHACPEGCPDVLASVPDPLMDFSHPYSTKAWKLSCLKTCLTPVHILVMKINWRVMWSVRRVRPDPGLLGRGRCLTSLSPYPDRSSKNFCPLFKTSPIGEG